MWRGRDGDRKRGGSVSRRSSHEVWMCFSTFKIDVRLSRTHGACRAGTAYVYMHTIAAKAGEGSA